MKTRWEVLRTALALLVAAGCSGQSLRAARDGAVVTSAEVGLDVAGTGGVVVGQGGSTGGGGIAGHGGSTGSGGATSSGGWPGSGGSRSSGGAIGTGGVTGTGGATACLDRSPLGAGVGGGACEGYVRCMGEKSATFGYETCNWLVSKGRASVFEAVRTCFGAHPDFCTQQPASVETCTGTIFALTCAGPGAVVDGRQVDCKSVAQDCTVVSEQECHRLTDVLNDKYYQTAFECYFRQSPRPADCRAALRECTGAPMIGAGGAGGTAGGGGGTSIYDGGIGGTGGSTASYDGGGKPACPYLAGTWSVATSCQGAHGSSTSNFVAVMSQTECKLSFTQTDDRTSTQWVSTGSLDSAGRGSLKGDFGFTDSGMCDLEATADTIAGRCGSATQGCELRATRVRP